MSLLKSNFLLVSQSCRSYRTRAALASLDSCDTCVSLVSRWCLALVLLIYTRPLLTEESAFQCLFLRLVLLIYTRPLLTEESVFSVYFYASVE